MRLRGEKGRWSVAEAALLPPRRVRGVEFSVGRPGAVVAALLEAVAVAVHLQDVDVMGKPVERRALWPVFPPALIACPS
jgi:hypothetical protein